MSTVVLIVGVGLLTAAIAAAITAAALLRREWDELDDVFAEARGDTLDPEVGSGPWSSFDLAALRHGLAAVDAHDPFATLIRVGSPVSWHAAPGPNGSCTNGSGANGAQSGPLNQLKPILWRAPAAAAR